MTSDPPDDSTETAPNEFSQTRSSKFKFKSKSKRSHRDNDDESRHARKRRRERESSHTSSQYSRSKPKYHETLDDDPSAYDDTFDTNARSEGYLNPDTAFRESLFDALADDEGAAFWEGVYGQPIHVYPATKAGPDGDLERMNEEEYAEHVRSRMWEKSHQYIFEERAKREEERKKRKEQETKDWQTEEQQEEARKERDTFDAKIAASLRKGSQRKAQKRWSEAWSNYEAGWERFREVVAMKSKEEGSLVGKASRGVIPWPVESGKWKSAGKEDVEEFFRNAPPARADLTSVLKVERVRWHPDKMQQRFGANKLDDETVRTITAVFQVIDQLWTDGRRK